MIVSSISSVNNLVLQKHKIIHFCSSGLPYKVKNERVLFSRSRELLEHFSTQYNFKHQKPVQHMLKRTLDIVVGSAGLTITAPIFLLSALLVKLDSKGPAFLKQKRIGKMGREFTLYKLRTMYSNSNNGVITKNDPRVTKIGKYLRKFSIDEFPQFINILKGDMSLIGPRPLLLDDIKDMEAIDPTSIRRLSVRPGARLNHGRGNIPNKILVEKEYLNSWSLKADLRHFLGICRKILTGNNY